MNADREALAARLETELRELADSAKGAGSPHTYAKFMHHCTPDTILTLLDTISSLRSQIERVEKERDEARKALQPFANEAAHWDKAADHEQLVESFPGYSGRLTVGDLRRAAAQKAQDNG